MDSSFMQAETSVRDEDEKKIDCTGESDCHVVTTITSLEDQVPKLEDQPTKEEDLDSSGTQIGGKPLVTLNFPDV